MGQQSDYSDNLSKRDLEVLKLYARGYTLEEMAQELFIDIRTIQHHSWSILGKMDARRNMRLAIYKAYKWGIISLPDTSPELGKLLVRAKALVAELEQRLKR